MVSGSSLARPIPGAADHRQGVPTDSAVLTYRYLRMMLAIPAVFIAVAAALEAHSSGHFRESISDYYQGPVRDVFVGGLMASAVCMIAYKGESRLEDYSLDFAGFNAFFVALVPNHFTAVLADAPTQSSHSGTEPLTKQELLDNLHLVLVAFLVTALLYLVLDVSIMHWTKYNWREQAWRSMVLVVLAWLAELAFVVLVVVPLVLLGRETVFGSSVFRLMHFGAAGLLIVNLSLAVASNAWPGALRTASEARSTPRGARRIYTVIALLMWLGLIVGGSLIASHVRWAIITTEYYEIALFVAFWAVSSRQSWRGSAPGERPARPT
jgi:hypothetical protein